MTAHTARNPALAEAARLNRLVTEMKRANADGKVTSAEKSSIVAHARQDELAAQSLLPREGDGVVAELRHIQSLAKSGKLALRVDPEIKAVIHERNAMWQQAKNDAHSDPLKHMRHFKHPFHGVATRDFNWHGHKVSVVAVDLANPHVKLETTGPGERGRHVEDFVKSHKAEVGINADFFTFGSFKPSGLNMKDGKPWGGKADGFEDALVFRGQHAEIHPGLGHVPDWARNVVSSRHLVVENGHAISQRELLRRHHVPSERDKVLEVKPRTSVGLSKDGRVLYLFAGMNMDEHTMGRLMAEHHVHLGFDMDSGGSAEMVRRRHGHTRVLQDGYGAGEHRHVANAILIQSN